MRATMIARALDAITCRVLTRPPPTGPRQGNRRRGAHGAGRIATPSSGGALVYGALLAIACYFTRISHVWLFWAAFILTRPLGATVGDFFDKPIANGGLNVSRPLASAIIAAFILICLLVTGGEGGIAAAILAAGPSGPTLRVVQNRSRRFCRTRWFRPHTRSTRIQKGAADDPFLNSGGEGGIRTHEHPLRCYWNSSPAPSTARPPLRSITYDSLVRTYRG
jgi:Repeat of Unknown Function (DUF347)